MSPVTLRPRGGFRRGARRPRRGVTVVEMIVAIVVLSIGIIGLAGTAAIVARQMTGGAQQTVAAVMAQARFERLASVPCATLLLTPTGSATARGITEQWSVSGGGNGTMSMNVSLSYATSRGARTVNYTTMRGC